MDLIWKHIQSNEACLLEDKTIYRGCTIVNIQHNNSNIHNNHQVLTVLLRTTGDRVVWGPEVIPDFRHQGV